MLFYIFVFFSKDFQNQITLLSVLSLSLLCTDKWVVVTFSWSLNVKIVVKKNTILKFSMSEQCMLMICLPVNELFGSTALHNMTTGSLLLLWQETITMTTKPIRSRATGIRKAAKTIKLPLLKKLVVISQLWAYKCTKSNTYSKTARKIMHKKNTTEKLMQTVKRQCGRKTSKQLY